MSNVLRPAGMLLILSSVALIGTATINGQSDTVQARLTDASSPFARGLEG